MLEQSVRVSGAIVSWSLSPTKRTELKELYRCRGLDDFLPSETTEVAALRAAMEDVKGKNQRVAALEKPSKHGYELVLLDRGKLTIPCHLERYVLVGHRCSRCYCLLYRGRHLDAWLDAYARHQLGMRSISANAAGASTSTRSLTRPFQGYRVLCVSFIRRPAISHVPDPPT